MPHDIGGLIWIVIVVIGVISSIAKNAKKRNAPVAQSRPRTVPMAGAVMPPVVEMPVYETPAPAAPAAPLIVTRRPQPRAVAATAEPRAMLPVEPASRTSSIRGMFQSKSALVRAIVAAEVLGPPKALQEQSIWSPRHNEPSI